MGTNRDKMLKAKSIKKPVLQSTKKLDKWDERLDIIQVFMLLFVFLFVTFCLTYSK